MTRSEIVRMSCDLLAGMLANPVMSNLCNPNDGAARRELMNRIMEDVTLFVTKKACLTIEE